MPYGIIRRTVFFESVFTQSSPFLATRNHRVSSVCRHPGLKRYRRPYQFSCRTENLALYPWLSLVWLPLLEYPADYRRLGSRSNSGLDQRAHARGLFPRLPRALLSDAHYSCAKAAIALATEAKGPT